MLHRLRPSDSSDFEWLMALDRTSHRDTVVNAGGSWNDADHRARFTRAFASQPMMVVEVDGEPAGMLSVAWDEEPVELHEVQLLPRWQGRGLGTRLVHDVLLEARQRGSAVALWVWEGNPAQVLYERLGFGVVERTDRRLRMRWAGGDDAVLRAAMSPWADAHRRRPWVRRLFEAWPDESPDDAVGFAGFVAGREGLPASLSVLELGCGSGRRLRPLAALGWRVTGHEPDPDHHAAARRIAAVAGSAITTVHAGLDALDVEAAHDLVLVLGGGLWSLLEHEARVDALRRIRAALRPGGVLVVEGPNVPWILGAYREPPARSEVYHRAMVSRIPAHDLDFHDGVLEHRDTFVVEADGEVLAEWEERRRLAMLGRPEIRLALRHAGLDDLETFRDLRATGPARLTGPRMVLTARTREPGPWAPSPRG